MLLLLYYLPLKAHVMGPYFFFIFSSMTSFEPSAFTQSTGAQSNAGTSCINFIIAGSLMSSSGILQAGTPSLKLHFNN